MSTEHFLAVTAIVFSVFSIIFLGYGLKRFRFIDDAFIQQANRLVFNVSLPLLLFYKIGSSNFSAQFNGSLLSGCILSVLLTCAASYGLASLRNYPPSQRGVFCQGAFRGNLAIVGLAVVLNAYGDEGLTRASVLMGFIVPLLNGLAVVALSLPHQEGIAPAYSFWLSQVLLNPLIVSSLAGLAWSMTGISFPLVLENSLRIVTGMTLPLALIAIGAGFTMERLHGDLRRAGLAAAIKIVAMPFLTGAILWLLHVHGMELAIGVLMIGSPSATVSYIMASQMKGDSELAGSIIILSTLFSILTYSLILIVFAMGVI